MELDSLIRLVLAMICVTGLIAARWRHEQQSGDSAGFDAARRARSWPAERFGRPGRHLAGGQLSQALYWLGLTTSAALAAQALADLVRRGAGG